MLFSEVYGTYYNVLAKLLEKAIDGVLTKESMNEIIRDNGFEESILTIPEALENQTWPLIKDDFTTPLEHKPTMPLTTLQKRWLKTILQDPRIRLFLEDAPEGLAEAEPLFDPETVVYFDRFSDGDPYEDEGYIRNFRTVVEALRQELEAIQ